jgi:hypothetical protein
MATSEIVPVDEVGDVEGLAHILSRRVLSLPMKCLGLPLGASYKATSIWSRICTSMILAAFGVRNPVPFKNRALLGK